MTWDAYYSGTVEERLKGCYQLYREHGETLRQDSHLMSMLDELVARAEAVNGHMQKMALGHLCIRCASTSSGGCCSLYMAGETDAVQMLINMLTGIDVKKVRDDGSECCFLGPTGCIFLFKPFFCLNYNCNHIHQAANSGQMEQLEKLTGELLSQQYQVEQRILALVSKE